MAENNGLEGRILFVDDIHENHISAWRGLRETASNVKIVLENAADVVREGKSPIYPGLTLTVISKYDGETALEFLKEGKVDVIIMDIDMPKKGGIIALRTLREQGNKTPVYMCSGAGSDKQGEKNPFVEDAFKFGATGYIFKDNLGSESWGSAMAHVVTMTLIPQERRSQQYLADPNVVYPNQS